MRAAARPPRLFARLALACLALAPSLGSGCTGDGSSGASASARVVQTRADLVGGDRALGDIGDYLLENDQIRVIIQRPGFSRGFGVYGGSLIDADLRRPNEQGTSGAGAGYDQFGELFPSFFVQACAVDEVHVTDDGKSGGAAKVQASGKAGDFLELLAVLNSAVTGADGKPGSGASLKYTTTYELAPHQRYVTIRFQVQNLLESPVAFPGPQATQLFGALNLPTEGFSVPTGDVALYGATSAVFVPGIGFDLRFGLADAYLRSVPWPGFPGFVGEFMASRGDHTSYGIALEESDRNFAFNRKALYDDGRTPIGRSSILFPFAATGFVGLFYEEAPKTLAPRASFEVVKYFVVGSGDVGSVVDTINDLRGRPTGTLSAQVLDTTTGAAAEGASVLAYQRLPGAGGRRIYSQYDVRAGGLAGGTLPPGPYSLRVQGDGRWLGPFVDVDVTAGQTSFVRLASDPPGRIVVNVTDPAGGHIPAKGTAVGTYDAEYSGQLTRRFLYDLQAGEPFRSTDLVTDDPARPETRRYVEATAFGAAGQVELVVRPGVYDVTSSRGPEYDTRTTRVTVTPAGTATVAHVLRRVVDTTGWVAADTHIHSRNSIDSPMSLDERVTALAAEGLEWVVSTDHNYVTDYAPYVARNELGAWLFPSVGVELTTLESGHFNGYPLRYETGPVTHGAFEWAKKTPADVFSHLRGLGKNGPDQTIVQVNHPRDKILGYFSQYARDPLTAAEVPSSGFGALTSPTGPAFRDAAGKTTFSQDYEALEIANGKLYWEIHHFRVPDVVSPYGALPPTLPPVGAILRTAKGEVAFPGAVDDWFNLLNLGARFIGVGTGDSHEGHDEAGQFRTMVYVGDDRPETLTDERVVAALRSRRVVATNGPLLDVWVDDRIRGAMGSTIPTNADKVTLGVSLTTAPWIGLGRLNVYRNGTIAKSIELDGARNFADAPFTDTFTVDLAKDAAGAPVDSWFAVEAIGYASMFPVIKPLEVPPVVLTDAIASLAGPLGIAGDEFGALRPPPVFPVTAYAITNPVWVTRGARPFQPPGPVPAAVQDQRANDPKFQTGVFAKSTVNEKTAMPIFRQPTGLMQKLAPRGGHLFDPRIDNAFDVRKALLRFGHAGHGH